MVNWFWKSSSTGPLIWWGVHPSEDATCWDAVKLIQAEGLEGESLYEICIWESRIPASDAVAPLSTSAFKGPPAWSCEWRLASSLDPTPSRVAAAMIAGWNAYRDAKSVVDEPVPEPDEPEISPLGPSSIATELVRTRLRRRMTVKAASDALGVSTNSYSMWEKGFYRPSPPTWPLVARFLGRSEADVEEMVTKKPENGHDHVR